MKYILGNKIIRLDSCTSTNEFAISLIEKGKDENGMVVTANFQTAGQGQENNAWISNPGENILMSLIYYPDFISPQNQFLLSKSISLGILDFISMHLEKAVISYNVKWPNDIYAGNNKIAGILIKNIIQGDILKKSVIGIGININQEEFPDQISNPTSLKLLTGRSFDLEETFQSLIHSLNLRIHQLISGSFDNIHSDYLVSLYWFNQYKPFIYKGKEIIARIAGVDEYGRLIAIKENDERIQCDIKEIIFLNDRNDVP